MSKWQKFLKFIKWPWFKANQEDTTPESKPDPKPDPKPEPPPKPSEYPSTTILMITKANHDNKDSFQRIWLKDKLTQPINNIWFTSADPNSLGWKICQGTYDEAEGCFVSMAPWWDFSMKYFVICKVMPPNDIRTLKTQTAKKDGGEYNKPTARDR